MPQLGPAEILVVLLVALLVFGPKRLPEVGRQVGRGIAELRKIQESVRAEMHDVMHSDDSAAPPTLPPITEYRTSGTPAPTPAGAHAPSRYRTAAIAAPAAASPPEIPAAATEPVVEEPAAAVPAPRSSPSPSRAGAAAPSRFRAPGA